MLPTNLPSDVRQSKILFALRRVGFQIDYTGGKGSHAKAADPKSGLFITVQRELKKGELKEILKAAEDLGYDAEEIMSKY